MLHVRYARKNNSVPPSAKQKPEVTTFMALTTTRENSNSQHLLQLCALYHANVRERPQNSAKCFLLCDVFLGVAVVIAKFPNTQGWDAGRRTQVENKPK